jgi:hypothetical protein
MTAAGTGAGAPQFASRGLVPLSVIIAGEKSDLLRETLAACIRNAGPCQLEFIMVLDDGSGTLPEDAAGGNPNVSSRWIPNQPGRNSRNLGAHAAKYEHLLFLDEGVHPLGESFFQVHASLHSSRSERNFAVLGEVNYENSDWSEIGFSPARFLGGLQPPGWESPAGLSFLDYRYFSCSNISIKKCLVRDWIADGFPSSMPPAVGGIEFAYRRSKSLPQALKIFHEPAALAVRVGQVTLSELMERQVHNGAGMRTLFDEYPAASLDFCLDAYVRTPASLPYTNVPAESDYTRIVEAIKAWARIVDHQATQRGETCPLSFLTSVMEVCFLQGLVTAYSAGTIPSDAGALILERFRRRCQLMPLGNIPVPDTREILSRWSRSILSL